eukprot:8201129-Alexandrium_andersonii.AAC.1
MARGLGEACRNSARVRARIGATRPRASAPFAGRSAGPVRQLSRTPGAALLPSVSPTAFPRRPAGTAFLNWRTSKLGEPSLSASRHSSMLSWSGSGASAWASGAA